jgi:nickel transport protein
MNFSKNKMSQLFVILFAAVLSQFFLPATLFAHSMSVYATIEGKTIQGKAEFQGGTPVKDAAVIAYDPAGEQLDRTKTDAAGKFSLEAKFHCDYRLLVDAGDGHGGEFMLAAKRIPADLPERNNAQPTNTEHQHETAAGNSQDHSGMLSAYEAKHQLALVEDMHGDIDALQEQIDQMKKQREFRDILGGLGFIVGIVGAAIGFYYRGLLKAKKFQEKEKQ